MPGAKEANEGCEIESEETKHAEDLYQRLVKPTKAMLLISKRLEFWRRTAERGIDRCRISQIHMDRSDVEFGAAKGLSGVLGGLQVTTPK